MELDDDIFQQLLATRGISGNAGVSQSGPQSMPAPTANPAPGPGAAMNVGGPHLGQQSMPTMTQNPAPGLGTTQNAGGPHLGQQSMSTMTQNPAPALGAAQDAGGLQFGQQGMPTPPAYPAPGPGAAQNAGGPQFGQQGMPTSPAYPAPGPGAVPPVGGQQGIPVTTPTPAPHLGTPPTIASNQGQRTGSNVAPPLNPAGVPSLQALAQRSDALRRQLLAMQGCPPDRIERSSQRAAGEIARRGEDARAELEANIVKVERLLAGVDVGGVGVGGRERPSKSSHRRKKQKKGEHLIDSTNDDLKLATIKPNSAALTALQHQSRNLNNNSIKLTLCKQIPAVKPDIRVLLQVTATQTNYLKTQVKLTMGPFQHLLGNGGNAGNGGGFPPGQPRLGSYDHNDESTQTLYRGFTELMAQMVAQGSDPVETNNALESVRNQFREQGEGYRGKLLRNIAMLENLLDDEDSSDDEMPGFYGPGPGMGGYPGGGYGGYGGFGGGFGGF
ncbi:hypothetical protein LTR17_004137 [Elasticomyces elasticus]|nr:hypothetical protein LTR17_004137 [Elasticomyces elasticus]